MKTILKVTACAMLFCFTTTTFAQTSTGASKDKGSKKATSKKTKGIDNKIAVSDQAQPSEKGGKKAKTSGISNK